MSGTSCDGASLALAEFSGNKCAVLAYKTYPYSQALTKKIIAAKDFNAGEISRLNFELGNLFAELTHRFLKEFKIPKSKIICVGSHGQTIYHGPNDHPSNTFQIGEPSVIAEKTGIPVVADFRPRDIAAGGQGAPLIPVFDQSFFGQDKKIRAMQNIGGIANVTVVGSLPLSFPHALGGNPQEMKTGSPTKSFGDDNKIPVVAFDNGPGNCLMDKIIQKKSKGKFSYDKDGKIAARGKIHFEFVKKMAAHPYFKHKPPKSTGQELFNEKFIPDALSKQRFEDIVATLNFFTAFTIWESYKKFVPFKISEIIVSGGGVFNKTLMQFLRVLFNCTALNVIARTGCDFFSQDEAIPTMRLLRFARNDSSKLNCIPVKSIADYGIHPQAKEPAAFAFLGLRAIEGKTNHLPSTTGAKHTRTLGKIIPAN